jgi:hypothetical protein
MLVCSLHLTAYTTGIEEVAISLSITIVKTIHFDPPSP